MTKRPRRLLLLAGLCMAMASLLAWKALNASDSIPGATNPNSTRAANPTEGLPEATDAIGPQTPESVRGNLTPRADRNSEPDRGLHIRGRVITQAGHGIEDARVSLLGLPNFDDKGPEGWPHTSSNNEGQFDLSPPAEFEGPLRVHAQGYAELRVPIRWHKSVQELGEITLIRSPGLSGRVVDKYGRPIAGAEVFPLSAAHRKREDVHHNPLHNPLAITDAAGRFQVPGPESRRWALAAQHPQYSAGSAHGTTAKGQSAVGSIEIVLETGALLRGKVRGIPKNAKTSYSISISNRHLAGDYEDPVEDYGTRWAPVDPEGNFVAGGFRLGEPVLISLWTEDRASPSSRQRSLHLLATPTPSMQLGPSSTDPVLDFVTPPSYLATFVDSSGTPIESLTVGVDSADVLHPNGQERSWEIEARFPGGQVQFEGWVPGFDDDEEEYTDRVYATVFDGEREVLYGDSPEFAVTLGKFHDLGKIVLRPVPEERKYAVRVQLVHSDGKPAGKGALQFRPIGRTGLGGYPRQTDSSGGLELKLDPQTKYEVRAFPLAPDYWTMVKKPTEALELFADWVPLPSAPSTPGNILRFDVLTPEFASITATTTYGGRPLPRARIAARFADCTEDWEHHPLRNAAFPSGSLSNSNGVYRQNNMLPGKWLFWVFHPDLSMPELYEVELSPGENSIEFARSETSITGRVVDSEGHGLQGVPVMVVPSQGEWTTMVSWHRSDPSRNRTSPGTGQGTQALGDMRVTLTDAQGNYVLEGATPKVRLETVALTKDLLPGSSEAFTLSPFESHRASEIVLRKGGHIHFQLPAGMRGDYWLDAITAEGKDPEQAHPGFWGSIVESQRTKALPPGHWRCTVEWDPIWGLAETLTHEQQIELRAGETITIDLTEGSPPPK